MLCHGHILRQGARLWHIDVSYLNLCGAFYYLCTIPDRIGDGYSRYIVHWEIRESMTEADVEIILQRGREAFPGVTPRIISDNGPQFVARNLGICAGVRHDPRAHLILLPAHRGALIAQKLFPGLQDLFEMNEYIGNASQPALNAPNQDTGGHKWHMKVLQEPEFHLFHIVQVVEGQEKQTNKKRR